jgi:membrane associated rhomboid family serine protease
LDDVDLEVGEAQETEETEEGLPSPNPLFSETPLRRQSAFRVRPRRAAVISRDDTVPCPDIESLEIDNPRAYFLARAERKIFQKAFVDRSDKLYTTLFVMLFKPMRFTTVNRTRAARTVPRFCVVILLAITFMFSTLISEYGAPERRHSVSSTFQWFVPHIISNGRQSIDIVELRQWGGATRCLVVDDGDFWRLFTAPFMHVTSNQFCANVIGLFVWGLHFESRYGCVRFVVVTILSLVGGLLMGLVWTDSNVFVVGADGAIAAHANMFLLDMLLNSKEKVTTKIFFGFVTMGFVTYALVTNSKNTISLYVGGVVPSFFFCYMFQSHFASERIEVILFLGSLSITILYFVALPLLVYMLPRGSKCVIAP